MKSQGGMMDIGKRIQKKREALGLNQEQLAKRVGCSRTLITQLESGNYSHGLHGPKVAAVKRALKVRVRGGVSPKKAAGRIRKPVGRPPKAGRVVTPKPVQGPDSVLSTLGLLLAGINRLADSLDRLADAGDGRKAAYLSPATRERMRDQAAKAREAKRQKAPSAVPVSEANGTSHPLANEPQPTPEALAA